MADDAPKKSPEPSGEAFDVVMLRGKTDDGGGTKVLRARPGRIETGEVRPMQEGKPLGSGEIVRLEPRPDAPALYDVHVEHKLESPRASEKPAQVATKQYRESWERTFGRRATEAPN